MEEQPIPYELSLRKVPQYLVLWTMAFASNDSVFPLIAGSCALIFLAAAMSSFKRWTRRAYAFIPGPDSSSLAGTLFISYGFPELMPP
jgi:hypothetical protein